MVLYVISYDIIPDRLEAYMAWAQKAIPQVVAIPGLAEFRAYRGVAGDMGGQVVLTYEFADMADFAAYWSHEDMRRLDGELQSFTANQHAQVWGPSPVVPAPIRPGA
jgi:antibiotic biosynthesis monooxygenase (ABM) superfamily enzyme